MPTYTYDVTQLETPSIAKMRLELGDTDITENGKHAVLCDEEIQSLISQYPQNWARAVYKAADFIYKRYSHQASFSDKGVSYQLEQLAAHWKEIRDEKLRACGGPTVSNGLGWQDPTQRNDGGHYFSLGMQDNPRSG